MIDFTSLTEAEKKLTKLQKGIGFLDTMVKMVFYSTFMLTIIIIRIAWLKEWEQLIITLTERWFTIMVGELIVAGAIQVAKEIMQSRKEIYLARIEKEGYND